MKRYSIIISLLVGTFQVFATSYSTGPLYSVRSLDARTGEILWETRPDKLKPKEIFAGQGLLKIISKYSRSEPETMWIDIESGDIVDSPDVDPDSLESTSEPFKYEVIDAKGRKFLCSPGNTKALAYRINEEWTVVRELDYYLQDLSIFGDLAIFCYMTGSPSSKWGGKIFAWNVETNKEAWSYDALADVPSAEPSSYTTVDIHDDRAYVAIEQHILALDVKTGDLLWKTPLPEQRLRMFDQPWTRFYSYDGRLLVTCYEYIFSVSPDTGAIIWHHDLSPFGRTTPLIYNNQIIVFPYNPEEQKPNKSEVATP